MTPLYLHGLPGSAAELALGPSNLHVLDRAVPSFAQLANALPAGPLHLIGFSLGAACALRLAALAPNKIGKLTLISPAAALELGEFLPKMAGAPVFRAARSHAQLSVLTAVQSTLVRLSPTLMTRMLAIGVSEAEAQLITSKPVQTAVQEGLTKHKATYLREISAYVQPWAQHLDHVTCPVTLHHGKADTWAPIEMSELLAARLQNATLHALPDLGHYGALQATLRDIR
ncbi:alpha/beta hydrolase [Tropicibacter sp. R15_0]|uniref:alpha/beta fold hydrolase n=1 Tax=Tropicibacter sp. R15_0 TaxID=2821101 RepID=UPI001ADB2F67|nr:alpha/beta hydrolase [Tropicibacter sp. R15_0]MBO9466050.1 alpha/beta hydrolase [Tropicibacter sp. R15_0]